MILGSFYIIIIFIIIRYVYFRKKYNNFKFITNRKKELIKFINIVGIKDLEIDNIIIINNQINEILKNDCTSTKKKIIKDIMKHLIKDKKKEITNLNTYSIDLYNFSLLFI